MSVFYIAVSLERENSVVVRTTASRQLSSCDVNEA